MDAIKNFALWAMGSIFFFVMFALSLLQMSATFAGIQYWLGWHWIICGVISGLVVFVLRLTLVSTIAGVMGAHYAWHFSWAGSFALFVGPFIIILAFAVLSGLGAKAMRW